MTLDRDAASKRALSDLPEGLDLDLGEVQELREGWFFPYRARNAEPIVGSQGVVVNKQTGRLLHLGSAFPVERDLEMYERGYHSEVYDLVIREVADLGKTLDLLEKLRLTVVEPEFESGQVWRVPRVLRREELEFRLATVPYVFGHQSLYFKLEVLEEARSTRAFQFLALSLHHGDAAFCESGPVKPSLDD